MRELAMAVLLAGLCGAAHAEEECGSLKNGVGPWDYRTASAERRDLVERFHFGPDVEGLRKGRSEVSIAGDLAYTLRAFPNHARALHAMAELARRQNQATPRGSPFTIDCWFQRAIRFQPDDGAVRLVYGIALLKANQGEPAMDQLRKAAELMPKSANVHYNLGLGYLREKNYDKAREHAKLAYELGAVLPSLREQLQRAGKWD